MVTLPQLISAILVKAARLAQLLQDLRDTMRHLTEMRNDVAQLRDELDSGFDQEGLPLNPQQRQEDAQNIEALTDNIAAAKQELWFIRGHIAELRKDIAAEITTFATEATALLSKSKMLHK